MREPYPTADDQSSMSLLHLDASALPTTLHAPLASLLTHKYASTGKRLSVFCLNTILASHFLKLHTQHLPYHLLLMTRMRTLDMQNETLRTRVVHPPFHPGTRRKLITCMTSVQPKCIFPIFNRNIPPYLGCDDQIPLCLPYSFVHIIKLSKSI